MSEDDKRIANQIWPQLMRPATMEQKLERAKEWLGNDYVLRQPVNKLPRS